MADIEKQVRELPRPVMWLGDTLGGMITGVHARFDGGMLEKMDVQVGAQIAFFGRYPKYVDWAYIGLDGKGKERLVQAAVRGNQSRARNEALLEMFRRN